MTQNVKEMCKSKVCFKGNCGRSHHHQCDYLCESAGFGSLMVWSFRIRLRRKDFSNDSKREILLPIRLEKPIIWRSPMKSGKYYVNRKHLSSVVNFLRGICSTKVNARSDTAIRLLQERKELCKT